MRSDVLIVDPYASEPYSLAKMEEAGLGGAERCVVTIAEGLDCPVLQYSRQSFDGRYQPVSYDYDPDSIIVLRDPEQAVVWADRYPNAKVFLWTHDHFIPGNQKHAALVKWFVQLMDRKITIVAVSEFHAEQIRQVTGSGRDNAYIRVIFNPVVPPERSESAGYDKDKLIFFSTPYKAKNIVEAFQWMRRRTPSLRLFVAMPQYADRPVASYPGIVDMGKLPHSKLLPETASSLCTFCPNFEFPETFGLVFAESHAMGTPVIAHDVGAAMEVIGSREQVLSVPSVIPFALKFRYRMPEASALFASALSRQLNFRRYEDLVMRWRNGSRPIVALREEFSLNAVLETWWLHLGQPSKSAV